MLLGSSVSGWGHSHFCCTRVLRLCNAKSVKQMWMWYLASYFESRRWVKSAWENINTQKIICVSNLQYYPTDNSVTHMPIVYVLLVLQWTGEVAMGWICNPDAKGRNVCIILESSWKCGQLKNRDMNNIKKDFREIRSENVVRTKLTQDPIQWLTEFYYFTTRGKEICGSICRSRDYVKCKNENIFK